MQGPKIVLPEGQWNVSIIRGAIWRCSAGEEVLRLETGAKTGNE